MKTTNFHRFILVLLLVGTCFQSISGKGGGRAGGGRISSSGRSSSSSSRYSSPSTRYSPSSSSSSRSRYSSSSSSSTSSSSRVSSSSSLNFMSPGIEFKQWLERNTADLQKVSSINHGASNPSPRPANSPNKFSQPNFYKLTPPPSLASPGFKLPEPNVPQPAFNPNYKDPSQSFSSSKLPDNQNQASLIPVKANEPSVSRQPAYNPNFQSPNGGSASNQPAYNPNFPGQGASSIQPSYNPNYKPSSHSQGYPPPSSDAQNHGPLGPPPKYSPPSQEFLAHSGKPPAYSPAGSSVPHPSQSGVHSAPYPKQPGMGVAPYPQQPGMSYPRQPGMSYPRQPGMSYPQALGANYPRQPGMSYAHPQQQLGSNLWHPQSGIPAPAFMNYGGLPTGGNMYVKPHKKKGFLGSLMSMGTRPHTIEKSKYGAYPSPYALNGFGSSGGLGGMNAFVGNHGNKATMYTILPYMEAKSARKLFKPRFGYNPIYFHHQHYHHHGIHSSHEHDLYLTEVYDVQSGNYVGKCRRPIAPKNSAIKCNSTATEVNCQVNCTKGYRFMDTSTNKSNLCWHISGVWRPTKNFPACEPVCNHTCLNGGSCIGPGLCGCTSDYRGDRCQYHFLKCDIRKLAGHSNFSWVCTHRKNGTNCRIRCRAPTEFENSAMTQELQCTPDGGWTSTIIPKCVIKTETTTEIIKTSQSELEDEDKSIKNT